MTRRRRIESGGLSLTKSSGCPQQYPEQQRYNDGQGDGYTQECLSRRTGKERRDKSGHVHPGERRDTCDGCYTLPSPRIRLLYRSRIRYFIYYFFFVCIFTIICIFCFHERIIRRRTLVCQDDLFSVRHHGIGPVREGSFYACIMRRFSMCGIAGLITAVHLSPIWKK